MAVVGAAHNDRLIVQQVVLACTQHTVAPASAQAVRAGHGHADNNATMLAPTVQAASACQVPKSRTHTHAHQQGHAHIHTYTQARTPKVKHIMAPAMHPTRRSGDSMDHRQEPPARPSHRTRQPAQRTCMQKISIDTHAHAHTSLSPTTHPHARTCTLRTHPASASSGT